jgi:hypothetical protein
MQLIEFLPDYSTWDEWNGNLVHYYAEQGFPVLPEDQWMDVARAVCYNAVFDRYSVPSPETFTSWQNWARALTESVNGDGA